MPDNAICMFCEDYGHKEHFCYTKTAGIFHHPLKPINCRKYNGIYLSSEQLEKYRRQARESEKVS